MKKWEGVEKQIDKALGYEDPKKSSPLMKRWKKRGPPNGGERK